MKTNHENFYFRLTGSLSHESVPRSSSEFQKVW